MLLFSGAAHILFGAAELPFSLVVFDGKLCWFDESEAPPEPLLPVDPNARMSYVYSNGRIYWSNGQVRGFVLADKSIYPWGIDTPPIQPLLQTTATGGLDAGRYQVAITWMGDTNGDGGQKTGERQAATI